MHLSGFITQHMAQILAEWDSFARKLGPVTDQMTHLALRDHARPMLEEIARDLKLSASSPDPALPAAEADEGAPESAASTHGTLRQISGFSLPQMTAELSALRATVLRLWLQGDVAHSRHSPADILSFNRFVDLALVESAVAYADQARVEGDRLAEAAKQVALLNALPAQIGLLDSDGGIVAVNEAWRQFGSENSLLSPDYAVGMNYLEICDQATGKRSEEAAQAAIGIRAVLAGAAPSFALEYPCHFEDQRRWFQMRATHVGESGGLGAVIVHVDVTDQKVAEEALRESERRFVGAFENAPIGMALVTPDGQFAKVNRALCDLLGYSEPLLLSKTFQDVTDPDDIALDLDYLRRLSAGEIPGYRMEKRYLHALGHPVMAQLNVSVVRGDDGAARYFISQVEGIGERKEAERLVSLANDDLRESESKVKRLNHVYAVLSQINAMIVRAGGRDELFREACRIAVEVGGFPLAWMGLVDRATMLVSPVATMARDNEAPGILHSRLSLLGDAPDGHGPAATAVREQKPFVANHLASDKRVLGRARLVKQGLQSMACLPIVVAGEAVAVFTLCAGEAGYFDEAELSLLGELAVNIAFALESIDRQHRLDYLAYYDDLTGLANRALFLERLGQQMRTAVSGNHKLAVCLVDIERFGNINDTLGREPGDRLLKQVAAWIARRAGDPSLVARMGVDHFALLVPDVDSGESLVPVLETLMLELSNHPFALGEDMLRVTVKIGVALYPGDGDSADLLLQHAEAALKRAKSTGEHHLFYSQAMSDTVVGKLTLESHLRRALDRGEFLLHFQPKVSMATGEVTSAEALIRWDDPDRGLVPPGSFIPILEETGLIHEVGRWALRKAIEVHLGWLDAGLRPVRIAVNVSALQLRNRGFAREVVQAVATDPRAAHGLELEITESMVMGDIQHGIACLQAIRATGVTIALDDFGTGFSSLSYLSRLPMDTLKIDRSFVSEMTVTREGLALVSTIITLAHSLKHKVVAEGVETDEQSRLLRLLGCDEMQGFVFGRPVPREAFEALYLRLPVAVAAAAVS